MALTMIVTNAGRTALVNAANDGTAPVTITQCGLSEAALTPSPSATSLPGEIKRLSTLSGTGVAADTIHLVVRDESHDVYSMRSFALYLQDGTLFCLFGQAAPIISKTAASMMLMAQDIRFADITAASLTFGDTNFLNPPATTEVKGVVELATAGETIAGTDAYRAVTPAGLAALYTAANVLAKLLTVDGSGSGLDADLLRGLTPEQVVNFARIVAGLGYTPVNKAGDTMSGNLAVETVKGHILLRASDGSIEITRFDGGAYIDFKDLTAEDYDVRLAVSGTGLAINGGKIWTISNDGSGSGLDADLLRGLTPEQVVNFARIVAGLGYTPAIGSGFIGDGDFNTVTNSGIYRFNNPSNGPAGLAWGQLLVMHGAMDTIAQIAAGYAGDFWVRSGSPAVIGGAGAWSPWKALVTADATSAYTAADVLAKLLTVDGAGSGTDADLLDGQQGSYYTNIVARLGYTPLNQASYTAADILAKLLTVDGAGSGLNADLLDGRHASDFALMSGFESGANANGYWRKTPDGIIEQWGVVAGTFPEGILSRNFPVPFTIVESISVQITGLNPTGAGWNDMWAQTANPTLTTFTPVFQATSSGNQGFGFHWRAIGR